MSILLSDEQLGQMFRKVWEDQMAFNTLFRKPPANVPEMVKQARDFVLYTEDELHELLRVFQWKEHRKGGVKENLSHMTDELADVFKCVISLMQICGMTPERLLMAYWHKSAVVQQRYREEWTTMVSGPVAVVDIDEVLCDYIGGLGAWLGRHKTLRDDVAFLERLDGCIEQRLWLSGQTLGVDEARWQELKHEFRTSGAKRDLPVFPEARAFLEGLRRTGTKVVLLTSRPIDRYPNLQTDTLLWLQKNDLPFDYLWWSSEKSERILDSQFRSSIRFVVDDDPRHLAGFEKLGIPCYLLRRVHRATPVVQSELVRLIHSLDELVP